MRRPLWRKLGVGASLAVLLVLGYLKLGRLLSLDYLATHEELLHGYQQDRPWLTYAFAFLIYAGVTGLSLPGATVLSLLYAWFFDLMAGVVLISFASTTGATSAFLLSAIFFVRPFRKNSTNGYCDLTKPCSERGLFIFSACVRFQRSPFL